MVGCQLASGRLRGKPIGPKLTVHYVAQNWPELKPILENWPLAFQVVGDFLEANFQLAALKGSKP